MPKRVWDNIDEEAVSQGNAFRRQLTQIAKRAMGKQIIKQRKMHLDGVYVVQRKLVGVKFLPLGLKHYHIPLNVSSVLMPSHMLASWIGIIRQHPNLL
jgi:hypothetical protein